MDVISELPAVPEADRDSLRAWSDLVVERKDGETGVPPAAMQASGQLIEYFAGFVAEKNKSGGQGLVEALLRAEVDGERLTQEQVMSFLFLMIIAGNETTTKMLANAIYWIARNPEQRQLVDADPSLLPAWVEETLRYDNSSQILARKAARDFELRGQQIREGEWVLLLVGSANRDEEVFAHADRFDLRRDCTESLSFGKGVHFCLGAQLARLEGRIGLEVTQEFFPRFEIDTDNLVRVHSSNVRGFSRMPIRFGTAG
jgi:cytochrome P450